MSRQNSGLIVGYTSVTLRRESLSAEKKGSARAHYPVPQKIVRESPDYMPPCSTCAHQRQCPSSRFQGSSGLRLLPSTGGGCYRTVLLPSRPSTTVACHHGPRAFKLTPRQGPRRRLLPGEPAQPLQKRFSKGKVRIHARRQNKDRKRETTEKGRLKRLPGGPTPPR